MSTNVLPTFFRQLHRQLFWLLMALLCTLSVTLLLFIQLADKTAQLSSEQLPKLIKQQDIKQQLADSETLLRHLLVLKSAQQLATEHQQLMRHWQQLAQLANPNNADFNELIFEHKFITNTVDRLVMNSVRNKQLTDDSKFQLQLVVDSLHELIHKKQQQQVSLYRQITQDQLTDRVTAIRAKAHAKLINQLLQLQQFTQRLTYVLQSVEQLSLQTSVPWFEQFTQATVQIFTDIGPLRNELIDNGHSVLAEQLHTLEQLFFSEHQLLAKWRGQLHLFEEYRHYLQKADAIVTPLLINPEALLKISPEAKHRTVWMERLLLVQQNLAMVLQRLSLGQWIWLLSGLFTLMMLGAMLSVSVIKRKLATFHQTNIALLTEQLAQQNQGICQYVEQQQLLAPIESIIHPKYSEQDHQKLVSELNQQRQLLAQWQQVTVWHDIKTTLLAEQPQIHILLTNQASDNSSIIAQPKSWRHYFSKPVVRQLLQAAKLVKHNNKPELLTVSTLAQHSVLVSIHHQPGGWFGTLANTEQVEQLRQTIKTQEQAYIGQLSQLASKAQHTYSQLQQLIWQVLLQLQHGSLIHYSSESAARLLPIYRKLQRVENLLHINKALTAKHQASQLNLRDSWLEPLVQSVVINAQQEAYLQKNTILIDYDSTLNDQVMVDPAHLEHLLLAMCQTMFAGYFNATLHLQVSLQDKNSGQQVVNFCWRITRLAQPIELPKILRHLLNKTDLQQHVLASYLSHQLQLFNAQALTITNLEDGYQLQVQLPMALSQQPQQCIANVEFKQLNLLLISQDKPLKQRLNEYFKRQRIACEHLANALQFSQQYSPKQLAKRVLDVVLLGNDTIATDYASILQQLAVLPSHCRPKLLVLQAQKPQQILRQGLFEQPQHPLFINQLTHAIKQLLASANSSNLVLSAAQLQPYYRKASQVTLLLAVQCPAQYQTLSSVLQLLGLQVRMVSDQQLLLTAWQSGRYLLMITEFTIEHEVSFAIGNKVARAIFLLNQPHGSCYSSDDLTITELVAPFDVQALAQQLSPWLTSSVVPVNRSMLVSNSAIVALPASVAVTKPMPVTKILNTKDDQLPVNIQQFAIHQGSPELAAMMLDDYLEDNRKDIDTIKQLISAKQVEQAIDCCEHLLTTAKIIAAPALISVVSQLHRALVHSDESQFTALMNEMDSQVAQLAQFTAAL